MTASFVVTAVTYERFGSLSEAIFALPFVRRLPRRYPMAGGVLQPRGRTQRGDDPDAAVDAGDAASGLG